MPLPPLALNLDPRDLPEPPVVDSVNIPLGSLPQRMHELPPRHRPISIGGPEPEASQALAFLTKNGRKASIACDWSFGKNEAGRLWEPNSFLAGILDQLEPGRGIDLACGNGRDAVAMAAMGWEVTAIDHLNDALILGRGLADRYLTQSEATRIEWVEADLESMPLRGNWDLISMFRYLNRDLIQRCLNHLRPGGSLVIETFTSIHRERHNKPRTEDFVLQPGELLELVRPLEIVRFDEGWREGIHTARIWARRTQ